MTARWAVRAATETEPSRPRTGVGETEPLMGTPEKTLVRNALLPSCTDIDRTGFSGATIIFAIYAVLSRTFITSVVIIEIKCVIYFEFTSGKIRFSYFVPGCTDIISAFIVSFHSRIRLIKSFIFYFFFYARPIIARTT